MRICYLASAASIHTVRWARHFASRGHEVAVVSFQPGAIEGVKVYQLDQITSKRRLSILLQLNSVRSLAQAVSPDILHAHYVTSYGLAGALAGRHPLVISAWGSDVLVTPESSLAYRQVVRFALSRADLTTSMSEDMTRHLTERGYAPSGRILTLPFGVDTDIFNLARRAPTHERGPKLVASTRRLDHGLDVDTFIRAVPKVVLSLPDARFVVASDGPLRPQLKRLASDLGVAEYVEFAGQIPSQEMSELLGQAEIFVSTSPSDGNNISLNEAMACGAFPVVTDIPANRTWIEHGRNGLLFPCRDIDQLAAAIIAALRQPEWRQAVMAYNQEIIFGRASWANQMARMEDLYGELLEGNSTHRR